MPPQKPSVLEVPCIRDGISKVSTSAWSSHVFRKRHRKTRVRVKVKFRVRVRVRVEVRVSVRVRVNAYPIRR